VVFSIVGVDKPFNEILKAYLRERSINIDEDNPSKFLAKDFYKVNIVERGFDVGQVDLVKCFTEIFSKLVSTKDTLSSSNTNFKFG
jgi:hypothetical protein